MFIDSVIVALVVGFLFGYFSNSFGWTKKIAEKLDSFFKRNKNGQV